MQMVASALGYCLLSFVVPVNVQSEQGELKSFAAHSGTEWRPSVTTPNLKPSFLCKMKSSSGVQRVYIPRGLVLPCLSEFSTVCCDPHSQGFGIVNKAAIDVFLELSCCFDDSADVGNLIFGSSAFSKSSLNVWKFLVHILLKPSLENFEHY